MSAILLRLTPALLFERIVPFLILFATIPFIAEGRSRREFGGSSSGRRQGIGMPGGLALNLLVAIYGGYFRCGYEHHDALLPRYPGFGGHPADGRPNQPFSCVNGVAAIFFISMKMVDRHYVLPMALAAIFGGYGAAGLAKRIGRVAVRRFVISVGFAVSLVLFVRFS